MKLKTYATTIIVESDDPSLTRLEAQVMKALILSSHGNGHDFGLIEDARGVVGPSQLGGVVASLVKKGLIVVHEPYNGWTQFTWPFEIQTHGAVELDPVRLMIEAAERTPRSLR